jgi:hypothetical protein
MRTTLAAAWLILALATRLTAQNSSSHRIIINIIRPNSVSVSSLPTQSITMDQSADPSSTVSLLKWQTNGRAKKITVSTQQDRSLWVETTSRILDNGKKQSLSSMDQNLLSADPRGSGQCLMKWLTQKCGQDDKPLKVALTVIEI